MVGKTLQQFVDSLREFLAVSKGKRGQARLDLFRQAGAVVQNRGRRPRAKEIHDLHGKIHAGRRTVHREAEMGRAQELAIIGCIQKGGARDYAAPRRVGEPLFKIGA